MAKTPPLGGHVKVDLNITPIIEGEIRGYTRVKDLIVLHETVSPDYAGFSDIIANAGYLARQGYGIHGIIDAEGYLGWAYGNRKAIVSHTASNGGNVNTRSVGIELVSRVMVDLPDNASRFKKWWQRRQQLDKLAQLVAFIAHAEMIPLRWSDGNTAGVTTHWSVTKKYAVYGGHVDCWPKHKGGYFPALRVIHEASRYHDKWWPEEV
jgi:hypothetical protein